MLYVWIRQLFRIIFATFFRWKVDGLHHVPSEGSVVVCANHISYLDPPLIGCAIRRKVHFMAKEELFSAPVLGSVVPKLGAFPVKRGEGDRQALKTSIRILKESKVLGIFPEGTRSKTGEPGKPHMGAALIALKTNSPIIPTAIIGPYRLFRPVRIVFGKPIDVSPYIQGKVNSEAASAVTEQMMEQIKQIMETYR
ncbi:lysophospholipid acyltransferase family protein [Paenactinomyces guangxiensis]|uniref:1-acyl-sn-glycerol-3-phosphate acyltransferase n=1 Tax=Paenactinomyces guangxiensis TaxID=1490290 RepID=A0A7W1WT67_9BACL|nr:lysophospholipid acyltransferase family protein [Paenactinomyces guangxiensis]MBA4495623.1 1-acyl-sn-glycerol-3-phosphate acyltransferase [Paenactinomyces guangxiensis]MBH8592611.1 1-acyl-sn-glycerol-3-phosphate acyltransferase [Paenactinomyces guangxiensis]